MRRTARFGILALAPALMLSAGAAHAATQLASTVAFGAGSGASDKVQQECQLQTLVPQAVQQGSADVQLVDKPGKGARSLELVISEVHAPGGGPFSGPKWMTVQGKLYDKGKVIGTVRAKRVTSGVFKGTCGSLGKLARVIGSDIATWLASPSMNAELGDAR